MGNLNCYAVVVPGLESVAADELKELAAHDVRIEAGGVSFTTTMDGVFRINLRSRVCTRILLRLASFRALSFPELYNKSKKINWQQYLATQSGMTVRASCHGSRLMHSGRAEAAVSDAVRDRQGVEANESGYAQQVLLRIENNQCTISLDTSVDRLDRRGYRLHSGKAPLRESIAAGMLRWLDWQPDEPLLAPMCGSGTFAIEAAWMAKKRAAGLDHAFAFTHWPSLKDKRWQRALAKAGAMQSGQSPRIIASELDAGILRQAKQNAMQAGVGDIIDFQQTDVRKLRRPEDSSCAGLIVCNPPYGDRVKTDVGALYAALGGVFKRQFADWRMAIIVPNQSCQKALGLQVRRQLKIKHGGKWVYVLECASRA